jgi:hypothetical protein
MKAVYKFDFKCGRQGDLNGLFVEKKEHVRVLIEKEIEVYFGEVLGKHSEIYGKVEESEIIFVSDNEEVVSIIENFGLSNGFNPFDYTSINQDREDFEDLTIGEIVEILINESKP